MADDPQGGIERRVAARHLLQHPLTCLEHDADAFRLIRRHEAELDRWFTQRLGYRLHVESDSARLFKSTTVPQTRPLRAQSDRAFTQLEYVLLALVLATTTAGPAVISLRDLIEGVRSAAAEAEVALAGDATERRALVAVLRWMIDGGLAAELHARVDAYATDEGADAVLRLRPDRIALLPQPAMVGVDRPADLLAGAERRPATRQWLRARLVEDPVVYRDDVDDEEWAELRRRLGEESRLLDEMFGLVLEARAEGVAAIDPTGSLADLRFPAGGTVGHAALLLIERLGALPGDQPDTGADGGPDRPGPVPERKVAAMVAELAALHARRWANDLVTAPERLTRRVLDLLVSLRLVRIDQRGRQVDGASEPMVTLLAAASRFRAVEPAAAGAAGVDADVQGELW